MFTCKTIFGKPTKLVLQAPEIQQAERAVNGGVEPEGLNTERRRFSFGAKSMSRQASDASNIPQGIVSLKLSQDGFLQQEGTDLKIQVCAATMADRW